MKDKNSKSNLGIDKGVNENSAGYNLLQASTLGKLDKPDLEEKIMKNISYGYNTIAISTINLDNKPKLDIKELFPPSCINDEEKARQVQVMKVEEMKKTIKKVQIKNKQRLTKKINFMNRSGNFFLIVRI